MNKKPTAIGAFAYALCYSIVLFAILILLFKAGMNKEEWLSYSAWGAVSGGAVMWIICLIRVVNVRDKDYS